MFKFLITFLVIIFLIFSCNSFIIDKKIRPVIVLCYHNINPNFNNQLNTKPKNFEKQIEYLKLNGYETILSKDLVNNFNDKKVIITFDDGKYSIYEHAYPIMKKYGYRGIIFLIVKYNIPKHFNHIYMNREQIKELIKEGWEVSSHTINHPFLNKLSNVQIEKQLVNSKKIIERELNINIYSVAYPYGAFDKRVISITNNVYNFGYSIIEGNNKNFNNLVIQRYMIKNDFTINDLKYILNQ